MCTVMYLFALILYNPTGLRHDNNASENVTKKKLNIGYLKKTSGFDWSLAIHRGLCFDRNGWTLIVWWLFTPRRLHIEILCHLLVCRTAGQNNHYFHHKTNLTTKPRVGGIGQPVTWSGGRVVTWSRGLVVDGQHTHVHPYAFHDRWWLCNKMME